MKVRRMGKIGRFISVSVFSLLFCSFAETAIAHRPAVVEALGYSSQPGGKTMSDLHREALSDALQNALVQAHSELQVEACTENMRLTKQTVQMISRGYVESSQTLEADFLPDNSSIYRVRIRARILPLPATGAQAMEPDLPQQNDPVTPANTNPSTKEAPNPETPSE